MKYRTLFFPYDITQYRLPTTRKFSQRECLVTTTTPESFLGASCHLTFVILVVCWLVLYVVKVICIADSVRD